MLGLKSLSCATRSAGLCKMEKLREVWPSQGLLRRWRSSDTWLAKCPLMALTRARRSVSSSGSNSRSSGRGELRPYRHDDEGADDMPAHIRTALTNTSLQLSFDRGRLVLGTWQAVYLWEHRASPQQRRLACHLLGE